MAPTHPTGKPGMPAMTEQTPTKSISARLMTMKFMQRAAASDTSPTTPTADEHSGKRRKVSHDLPAVSPSTPLFDMKAAQAAMEEEEKKREAAVARLAQQLGDSHWVLEAQAPTSRHAIRTPLNVVHIGFAQIDSPDTVDETHEAPVQGKKRFGIKAVKKEHVGSPGQKRKASDTESDSVTDDSEAETSDEPGHDRESSDSARQLSSKGQLGPRPQESFSRRRNEERKKSQQFAGKRRKKEMNLNRPKSISSAGSGARLSSR